jgi:drug/metabolite transporter (DMT)-like permease
MSNHAAAGAGAGQVPFYLVTTGALLAASVLISKLAASAGAPMLWFLANVMAGSGAIQLAVAARRGHLRGALRLVPYSLGAGAFMALPSAMGYLAVGQVGAGYISLTFAFPILLTWALARALGLEAADPRRLVAVLLGLGGGVMLALAKFSALPDAAFGWTVIATLIPGVIALGNIYRSRFWPTGASSVTLAGLMMLAGAALTLPFAAATEGSAVTRLWTDADLRLLTGIDIAVFTVQYVTYFTLQRLGGPVVLSQIGPVAAVLGASAAQAFLAEPLPPVFPLAVLLVGAGLWLIRPKPAPGLRPAAPSPR